MRIPVKRTPFHSTCCDHTTLPPPTNLELDPQPLDLTQPFSLPLHPLYQRLNHTPNPLPNLLNTPLRINIHPLPTPPLIPSNPFPNMCELVSDTGLDLERLVPLVAELGAGGGRARGEVEEDDQVRCGEVGVWCGEP